jgi:hypothetical protein
MFAASAAHPNPTALSQTCESVGEKWLIRAAFFCKSVQQSQAIPSEALFAPVSQTLEA